MFKTGLLVISNPKKITSILSSIQKQVKNTLYIQILSALGDAQVGFQPKVFKTCPRFSKTIFGIYANAANQCDKLDVRVLLSGIKYNISKIQTRKPIDLIIFDKPYPQTEIDSFIKTRIQNITTDFHIVTLDSDNYNVSENEDGMPDDIYKHTVLGGTFDRLHTAHKLLLSEAALRSSEKVTVGVTEENMLQSKILWELIEDIEVRVTNVSDFLKDICPELEYNIVPISDPFGPAIVDPSMEMIVVSEETMKGGEKINSIRQERGLAPLKIFPVELMDEPNPKPIEEQKISSSTTRIRLLGTLLKPVEPNCSISKTPYIIGLTGGIASGKSGVASHLKELGAFIINCDQLGHDVYKTGKPCHQEIVKTFGKEVLCENGEINRQILGGIVFKNSEQMNKLNSIVWPAIAEQVKNIIKNTSAKVFVIEAAVLLSANWEKYCHEIWATTIPRREAIIRLINRNKLTEEQANNRIDAQPSNCFYVKAAHVVFCTLWPVEYTKEQVVKAWQLMQERL
ncbi:bifunctional coenzyme A synthase-like [Leptinotarsa decemlineata]|uniref:bifunctional coenzyme A synthase-like n=1 Tax=Leptinotarsa decemlineata TaxID=7539 RepID=UPI003D304084